MENENQTQMWKKPNERCSSTLISPEKWWQLKVSPLYICRMNIYSHLSNISLKTTNLKLEKKSWELLLLACSGNNEYVYQSIETICYKSIRFIHGRLWICLYRLSIYPIFVIVERFWLDCPTDKDSNITKTKLSVHRCPKKASKAWNTFGMLECVIHKEIPTPQNK